MKYDTEATDLKQEYIALWAELNMETHYNLLFVEHKNEARAEFFISPRKSTWRP